MLALPAFRALGIARGVAHGNQHAVARQTNTHTSGPTLAERSVIRAAGLTPSPARYGSVAQVFHWLIAILVLAAFIFGPGGSEQRVYSPANADKLDLHEALGTTVLALTALRLLWRMGHKPPAEPPMPAWIRSAAAATHHTLYLLLLVTPLTAITGAWLEGHEIAA